MELVEPKILDVTIRDGSYLVDHNISIDFTQKLARGLTESGIRYAEICHGAGIGGGMVGYSSLADDDELMEAALGAAPNLKLSAFIPANDKCIPLIPGLSNFFEMGRIGVNIDSIPSIEKIVKKLIKYKKTISVQLVRTHAKSPEFAATAAKQAQEIGADIVYIVDSFGSMAPQEVKLYIEALKSEINVEIGFHGHNHTGLAVPNAIAAWEAGASWIDASLMGVGRAPGNTVLEALVLLLQEKGSRQDIKLNKLCETTLSTVLPFFQEAPKITLRNLFCAKEKIDFVNESVLDLMANVLMQPISEFISNLRQNIGDKVQLEEKDIRHYLKEQGHNYDKLIGAINSNA
ncbi:MAG: hypothetical protein H7A32_02815 [Deltaproteobacteria bacterium]|nr:hypothetical protein [Deltaproteobacteria bacterium]